MQLYLLTLPSNVMKNRDCHHNTSHMPLTSIFARSSPRHQGAYFTC